VVWKNWKEFRDGVMSRNMLIAWVPHGVHMVHACMTEIKEYDVRAYGHSMLALR